MSSSGKPFAGVVDVSNGRKLQTGKGLDIRQVGPVEIDVAKSYQKYNGNNYGSGTNCADYNRNRPTQATRVIATKLPRCRQSAFPPMPQPYNSATIRARYARE